MLVENSHIELKREFTDELKKEVVAFANTSGGKIYIGIEDDGSVVGIDEVDKCQLRISNMLSDTIRPDITMFVTYENKQMENKDILVIQVQQGTERPYYLAAKGLKPSGVFLRQGSSSAPSSESAIRKLIKETDGDKYELMRSLNQELTFEYALKEFAGKNIPFGDSQMVTLSLVIGKEKLYTNLGLLLSDQAFHTIKVAIFQGKTKEIFKDRREFGGSVLKQLTDVYEFIDLNNHTRAEISGLYRMDKRDYPEIALREALLNAIVHREYSFSSSTLISIFDDRIEIVSVGGLVSGVTLNDIMFGISVARNEKLAGVFYRLELIEAYGTGVAKIMDCYKKEKVKPEIEVSDNAFRIILPNLNWKRNDSELSENQSIVMDLFETRELITRKDVEHALNISQTMAGRVIKQLTEKGLVVSKGAGPRIMYEIKIK